MSATCRMGAGMSRSGTSPMPARPRSVGTSRRSGTSTIRHVATIRSLQDDARATGLCNASPMPVEVGRATLSGVVNSPAPPTRRYEAVIGIECHVQLRTASKMFCGCSTDFQDAPPNSHTCPVCLAMPGVLPVINRLAVRHVLATGIAIGAHDPRGHALGPQELLLSRPAQGLPDQPVRPAAGIGRQPDVRHQRGPGDHQHHPRPPGGGHGPAHPPGRRRRVGR